MVEGRVTVTPEGGEPTELGPGDTAFFPAGTRVLWEVHETLRKSWHIYDADGDVVRVVRRFNARHPGLPAAA